MASARACSVPLGKLKRWVPEGFSPVAVVACGSFSPPTLLHLRIMEEARDALLARKLYPVGGFLSPVHAAYGKASLAPMADRLAMARLATASSDWIEVDGWECAQPGWTRTAVALQRFADELGKVPIRIGGRAEDGEGEREGRQGEAEVAAGGGAGGQGGKKAAARRIQVTLLCGSDLLETFATVKADGEPLWLPADRSTILSNGVVCIERVGTSSAKVIEAQPLLREHRDNIFPVQPAVENSISSTVVRRQLALGRSIRYLVPDPVVDYIRDHALHKLPNWQ